jgi:hypothetical protein
MKPITLHELLEHHEVYARSLAERHALGPLEFRSVEGQPNDAVRTAIATFRFERGTIRYDGIDYRIENEVTTP